MSIKILRKLFFILIYVLFSGCVKKDYKKMAENYYKFALLEVEDGCSLIESSKRAIDCLDKAIQYDDRLNFHAIKASLLFRIGNYEEAKNCFEKIVGKCSDLKLCAEILNNYACLLCQIKEEDKALAIWKKLEVDKNYYTPEVALFNQAKMFLGKRDYKKAKELLVKASEIAPDYLDAHYYLALIVIKYLKQYSFARSYVDRVLLLEPTHTGALKLDYFLKKQNV